MSMAKRNKVFGFNYLIKKEEQEEKNNNNFGNWLGLAQSVLFLIYP